MLVRYYTKNRLVVYWNLSLDLLFLKHLMVANSLTPKHSALKLTAKEKRERYQKLCFRAQ
jgi:hypothetical protein